MAAYTTSFCLVVAGAAFVWGSADEVMCRLRPHACRVIVGVGGTISLLALAAIATGVGVFVVTFRRPLSPGGSSAWRWGEGVLFALGAVVLVSRLSTYSCPSGFHVDKNFGLCISPDDRFAATSRLLLKTSYAVIGVLLGFVVAKARWLPRWIGAILTAAMWFVGMGWLLGDTVARELLH